MRVFGSREAFGVRAYSAAFLFTNVLPPPAIPIANRERRNTRSRTTQGTDTSVSALQTLRAVRLRLCRFALAFVPLARPQKRFSCLLNCVLLCLNETSLS